MRARAISLSFQPLASAHGGGDEHAVREFWAAALAIP